MPRYSATVMDHFQSPRNWGKLDCADLVGVAGVPGRGRLLVLHLKLEAGRIAEAGYQCHGCGATIAAGSMLTELITGRSVDECREFSADDLLGALEGLPPDKRHCARFAVTVLQNVLDQLTAAGPSARKRIDPL
jgi:nitrogen fixation NifU-like protein